MSEMSDGPVIDALARAIHGDYLRRRSESRVADPDDAALRPWPELTEALRRSNRAQAEHLSEKLRRLGWEIVPAGTPRSGPLRLSPEELEDLAHEEHERWRNERLADGWVPAAERDAATRRTPYLVGWDDLSDEVRDLDRAAVSLIPDLLEMAGLAVVRAAG